MQKNEIIYFLYEGDDEEHFLKSLKKMGKIKKLNLWQDEASKFISLFGKKVSIYIIYDTDHVGNIEKFIENLNVLKRNSKNIYLLQQTLNFEDEMMQCFNLRRQRDLYNIFSATTLSDFKHNFRTESNLFYKLKNSGFSYRNLWGGNIINQLKDFSQCKVLFNSVKKLFREF